MPRYNVKLYNSESGMLHSEIPSVLAPDPESAEKSAIDQVKAEIGYQQSADGGLATAGLPRFRVAVTALD